ncbi:MAG: transglycosylase SLT domain-containing protein [Paracoccaceae bacterium]
MSRLLRAFALVLMAASCGSSSGNVSRSALDNACTLVSQNPTYLRAFKQTERRWGVPVEVQMATIYQESKFKSDARTPFRYAAGVIPMGRQSSAFGYAQALDATWKEYKSETNSFGARRNRIKDATDFMGWYMNKTQNRNGVALSDARNQYLAYHEGHTGFARGSYRKKAWLVRVAGEVDQRSNLYAAQLSACGRA